MSTGLQGPQGPLGPTGSVGIVGPTGRQGPRGREGPTGTLGVQGPNGVNAAVGAVGPTGPGLPVVQTITPGTVLLSSGSASSIAANSQFQYNNRTLTLLGNTNVNGSYRPVNGDAGFPSYSFSSDITTGMFSPATSNLAFSVLSTEDMRILSNGNVGIGVTAPSFQLQLSTDSAAKPTSSTWTISSDQRIKRNIEDADTTVCYNTIKALKLKRFEWDPSWNPTLEDKHSLGFIAQEVKQYFPKAVKIMNANGFEDFHSLDSDQIYKTMYGALVKLIERKEDLEQRVKQLKEKIPV